MKITRRSFLRVGSVSTIAAGLNLSAARHVFGRDKVIPAGKGLIATPYSAKTGPAFYFTPDTFAPYINSTFRLSRGKAATFNATLVAVTDLSAQAQANAQDFKATATQGRCFSLTFRAGERDKVPQGAFTIDHAALGRFVLFVVPGAPAAAGAQYEAVINHLA
jgi:hypothetical protein